MRNGCLGRLTVAVKLPKEDSLISKKLKSSDISALSPIKQNGAIGCAIAAGLSAAIAAVVYLTDASRGTVKVRLIQLLTAICDNFHS